MARPGGTGTASFLESGSPVPVSTIVRVQKRLDRSENFEPKVVVLPVLQANDSTQSNPRHRQVVERILEPVRLDQQYLKHWRITPTVGGAFAAKTVVGGFFDRYVDLDALLDRPDRCTAVAECVLACPGKRAAVLRLGFDEKLTVELNGEIVFHGPARRVAVRDEFTVPITLRKGENHLKLTVSDKSLGYGFFARLSDGHGELMKDVTCGIQ